MDPPAPFHPTATRRVRNPVRVGVGVIVSVPNSPGSVYAGVRLGSHGEGSLALPGGHLELYESWEECAKREVLEEMNLQLRDLQFAHVTNDIMREEEKHYVTLFIMARLADPTQTPQTMEPQKCQGWKSYSWKELEQTVATSSSKGSDPSSSPPPVLFGPLKQLIRDAPEAVLRYIQE